MKNCLFLIFLFTITSSYSQSNYSFNLVAKYGIASFESLNNFSPEQTSNTVQGQSYTFGIEANKFFKRNKHFSVRYGFLNQLNRFSYQSNSRVTYPTETYDATYNTKIKSLEILLPIKLHAHLGNWSIYGGLVPTYHFKTSYNQKTLLEPKTANGENLNYESNIDGCNSLYQRCFSGGTFRLLNDFELQYTTGIQYQLKRFSFFCEFSDYLWAKSINPYGGSEFALIDVDFGYFPNFGSFGQSFSFGTSYKIY